jgi:hypothetical protein
MNMGDKTLTQATEELMKEYERMDGEEEVGHIQT